jgi:hypothetical protein
VGFRKVNPVYLVLGMHRSGTSAATQLLALAGCGLPENLVTADEHNARGYFEPWRVAVLNDERLRAAGGAWDDPFGFPFRPLTDDETWRVRAAGVLTEEYGAARSPLLKDPRVSVLLPLWRPVFDDAGLSPLCVIPVRDPLEVAGSLAKRDGFSPDKSILLWCAYMLAAEAYSRDLPRVFVSYDALLTDWRTQAARIEKAHARPLPKLDEAAAKQIDAFLSPEMRHHRGGPILRDVSPAGALAAPLLDWFMAATRDEAQSHAALDQAADALAALQAQVGALVSPLTRDLDQTRADLLYTRQLMELERANHQAQLNRIAAAAQALNG